MSNLKSSLEQDFGKLLESEEFSDFALCVGDKVFPAHKCILAARSSVFRSMFKYNMKETQDNRVHITDMDTEVVNQMLRFIYTDEVETEKLAEFAADLLVAAEKVCVVIAMTTTTRLISLF